MHETMDHTYWPPRDSRRQARRKTRDDTRRLVGPDGQAIDDGLRQSAGGIWAPERVVARHKTPTAVDLFCGIGGGALGLIQAGFEVVCGIDNDELAMAIYLLNLGKYPMRVHFVTEEDQERFNKHVTREIMGSQNEHYARSGAGRPPDQTPVRTVIFGDMRKVTGEMIAEVAGLDRPPDLLIGSPPCQGFSRMNRRRKREDKRNALIFEMARIINELKPSTFMFENVPGIVDMMTAEGIPVMTAFQQAIQPGGYAVYDALRKARRNAKDKTAIIGGPIEPKSGKSHRKGTEQRDLFDATK